MSRIVLFFIVFLASAGVLRAAPAGDLLFGDFDAAAFDAAETRLLQAALASTGDYGGPLDGAWNADSQAGIAAYAAREFGTAALNGHAAALALSFAEEVTASGWELSYLPDLDVSLALPLARLGPPATEPEGGARRWSDDGRLGVLTHDFDPDAARRWHAAAAKANADPQALVSDLGATRMVTAGLLKDGRGFYTRSDRRGARWSTIFLVGEPDQAASLNLAAASIMPARPQPWSLPAGGRLSALVSAADTFLAEDAGGATGQGPVPRLAALPATDPDGTSTGTGFYLGARTLVTAQHVVEGCARVTLADGRPLQVIAGDPDLDIAALQAPARAGRWLALADGALRLGQQVHAAGFPYYAIAGTSLNLTGGNVSALSGVDDDGRFFTFSAPVQPGNSGGPLIDSHGGVRGLVVARLSEDYIVETTGSLPQNVNYALGEAEIARFLRTHGVDLAPGGLGGYDMADGAPPEIAQAVVPIVCHG